jgi:hypothetical protein
MRGFAAQSSRRWACTGFCRCCCCLFGSATFAVGFLLALPWWAASSYAAWKDNLRRRFGIPIFARAC